MKLVMAVIQPHRLDAVREALSEIGVDGMTVTEVRGFGRQKGHTEIYRGAEYAINYTPKIKIEIATADDRVEKIMQTIRNSASTGKIGDGKIFVFDLEQLQRVRTGESGEAAI